jgi:hypothetical protein
MAEKRSTVTDTVTVVMYHYIRPIATSRYPGIKGLELERFRFQVDHICRRFTPISMDLAVAVTRGDAPKSELPPNPAVLTFDDGYADHYLHALPILLDHGVPAAFYPPSSVVLDRRVLDVNKIHFVLACTPDKGWLAAELDRRLECARCWFELDPTVEYHARCWHASRFDPPEVIYVKRMLQHVLPRALREEIATVLFHEVVSADEREFANELYLSLEQLREMAECGMHVGSHGDRHFWLDQLPAEEQAADIDRSLMMRGLIGLPRGFTFCYPYGGYNSDTLDILQERGCVAAFTTEVAVARPGVHDPLKLPRLDTNDLPSGPN